MLIMILTLSYAATKNTIPNCTFKDVRKTPGFRVWTFGSLINAAYMILIPSVLVLFNKPDDNFFPWHVSHENKGLVAFFLYVLPVYLVFATLMGRESQENNYNYAQVVH